MRHSTHSAVLRVLLAGGMWLARFGNAQAVPDKELAFEVASVKPVPATTNLRSKKLTLTGNRFSAIGPVTEFLQQAYDLEWREVTGPDWIQTDRFEIEALTKPGTTREEAIDMFRVLLAERFGLKFHRSAKQVDGYLLTGAPEDFKFKPIVPVPAKYSFRVNLGEGSFRATAIPFNKFVSAFGYNVIGAPIEDRTGISGSYTFDLEWRVDPGGPPVREPQADSWMLKVVGESLGLKFTKQRVTLKMLNIDHIERKPIQD